MLAALLLVLVTDTVRVVSGGAVSAAVAGARPGDVVLLGAGRHEGNVVLDRRITLAGAPGAVVAGSGRGSVIRVTGSGARVTGLTVERSGGDIDRDDAGVAVEADSVRLEDLVVRDVLHGVYLREARAVELRRVTIRGRARLQPNDRGDGIHFFHSVGARAEHNDIADVRDGMYFSYSDSAVVRGNSVTRSRYGLHYMFSHVNVFEDNRFTHSAAGSSIMNSRDVVARRNVFAWNRGVSSFGLLQQTTERTVLEENAFVGNGTGLWLDGAVDGVIRHNLVAGNFVGLALLGSATGNLVAGNAITGNTYAATGDAADSRFCADGGGNWWDGDRGYDLDGDGRHDLPYRPGSPLTELSRERPALRLYLGSPAASALEWAERALPVFRVAALTDDCPLAEAPVRVPAVPAQPALPSGGGAMRGVAAASLMTGVLLLGAVWRTR